MKNRIVGDLITTLNVSNQLGEGVQWNDKSQTIWWTDIESNLIYCYSVVSNKFVEFHMPDRVGCFSFTDNDEQLIVGFAKGIALFNIKNGQLDWLAKPEDNIKGNRFNDGRTDRQGRFWSGTMVEYQVDTHQQASLYFINDKQECQKVFEQIQISNSLCWSPDSLTMYHADSPSREIYQYSFDPISARVSNKKLFATSEKGSFPDGSCVDSQGYLWNAQWGGGRVVRYHPNGEINLVLHLPISQPTCVTIGGSALDWLIITSAKQDLDPEQLKKEPLAGSLFIYQLYGVKGLPESRYSSIVL